MINKFLHRGLVTITLSILVLALVPGFTPLGQSALAACTTPLPTAQGTVTVTSNIATAGTYRAWFRVYAPSTSASNFWFQADQAYCNISVGGGTAIPANTWTWVDYQSGTTTNKINLTLATGSHTFIMAGQAPGLMLDRVILTTDTACTPTGTGDNCGSVTVTLVGDLNNDSHVNIFDLSILLNRWASSDASADLNNSGTVDIFDLSILLGKWTG